MISSSRNMARYLVRHTLASHLRRTSRIQLWCRRYDLVRLIYSPHRKSISLFLPAICIQSQAAHIRQPAVAVCSIPLNSEHRAISVMITNFFHVHAMYYGPMIQTLGLLISVTPGLPRFYTFVCFSDTTQIEYELVTSKCKQKVSNMDMSLRN